MLLKAEDIHFFQVSTKNNQKNQKSQMINQ